MELNNELVQEVSALGFKVSECKNLTELCKLLPPTYYFVEKRLWCNGVYVDADNYDYGNAVLKMIIKLF